MDDFPKTTPVPRGCGERTPGGVYIECGLSRGGSPLEAFLVDPPLPPPPGMSGDALANKAQLWVRTSRSDPQDPTTERVVMHPGTEIPIVDILIWIGAQHYPYVSDFIEEVRRFGASRKLNPNLDLTQLTRYSRMILLHPHALNTLWAEQRPPHACLKERAGHTQSVSLTETGFPSDGSDNTEPVLPFVQTGPCLFKCYDLLPVSVATLPPAPDDESPLCLREIGSTLYSYQPTGESAEGLTPGIFAILPITGFALIQYPDGRVNEQAKAKIVRAQTDHEAFALPSYETEK